MPSKKHHFFGKSALLDPRKEKMIIFSGLSRGLTPQEIAKEYKLLFARVCLIAQNIIDEADIFKRGSPRFREKGKVQ